ncbi:hypothetical protein XELAEV_18009523mg [Xenopus laevis]|uniref:CBM20 domain-containing protein n=1 Tax=Xenopus laevis TaxID=8355 RepID=A0A974DSV4_XENLA|nr:hypothetical protein XELAEV_18009523mg [Xenopus laevis]
MPCEDQVVECEFSPSVQTGAITECQEQEDAFSTHRSEGRNVQSPEKIDLVSATILDAKLPDIDHTKIKRVAAVQPMPHSIKVDFKVHYITNSDTQWLAVTGNNEKLGGWETFVLLKSGKDGFRSHSAILPADTNVEWKFVMVENGKIKRWEECSNRSLTTGKLLLFPLAVVFVPSVFLTCKRFAAKLCVDLGLFHQQYILRSLTTGHDDL